MDAKYAFLIASSRAIPHVLLTANLLGAFYYRRLVRWFNRMTHIDPMWKGAHYDRLLRRPDDLFSFFYAEVGILFTRGALWLGAAECS